MTTTAQYAKAYIERLNLALVQLPPGKKAPTHSGWNKPGGWFPDSASASRYYNANPAHGIGVVLAPSKLCSLDVDNMEDARLVLGEFGIDIDALAKASPTVVGNPARFRIMFAVPEGEELSRKALSWPNRNGDGKDHVVFELRAGDLQDVLPPSLHPETGKPYRWLTKPTAGFSAPPDALLAIWRHWDTFKPQAEAFCPWIPKRKPPETSRTPGNSVIEQFVAAHPIDGFLERYGYMRMGKRWLSPHSTTRLPGVCRLDDDRVFIHHASDPLRGDRPVNAFDLWCHYEHGGDVKKSVKEAAKLLGLPPLVHLDASQAAQAGESMPYPSRHEAEAQEGDEWPELMPLVAETQSQPYPLDALPGVIGKAVREVVGFVQCPDALAACSALSAVSLAVQGLADVRRDELLSGPSSLYLLAIAESGERKTTCDTQFLTPIREWEAEQFETKKPDIAKHAAAMRAWEARRKGLLSKIEELARKDQPSDKEEKELVELEGDKPKAPKVPRVVFGDATPEALAWMLKSGWPSAGVLSSEAGTVFGGHGMKADSVMRNLSLLNVLWEGGTQAVDRKQSESFILRGVRFTMGLAAQPETVRAFLEGTKGLARGSGFAARFLIAWPESTQGSRLYRKPPATVPNLSAFRRRISDLLGEPLTQSESGELAPLMLELTPGAKAAWEAFHNDVERELRPGGDMEQAQDVASKTADNATRLAALFHVFEHGPYGAISEEHLRAGARIAGWHLYEARRFLGTLALPRAAINAGKLEAWLLMRCKEAGADSVSTRDVRQFGPGALRNPKALDEAIAELREAGRARIIKSGRQRRIYPNPALLTGGNHGAS